MKQIAHAILLAVCVFGLSAVPATAQECSINLKEYVLKVRGSGEFSVEPDSFSVRFIVESESSSIKGATKDNSEKILAIRKSIEQLKVPNMEFSTASFSFDRGEKGIFAGRKCKIENAVTVKAEKLGYDKLSDYASGVIDAAIANGATQAREFLYYLKDENNAEESAIEVALNNAKSKASLAAKNLGVSLKKPYIVEVLVRSPNMPVDSYDAYRGKGILFEKSLGCESQITAGKITYIADTSVEYKFD